MSSALGVKMGVRLGVRQNVPPTGATWILSLTPNVFTWRSARYLIRRCANRSADSLAQPDGRNQTARHSFEAFLG